MSGLTDEEVAAEYSLIEQLRESFEDEEYRNAYAESFLNSYVAAQIKVLREAYPMTQSELAEKIGTQQPGIARLENVNYSAWKVETLRKVARAFKVRLRISFEEWGALPEEIETFRREHLLRARFDRDPVFFPAYALGRAEDALPDRIEPHVNIGDGAERASGQRGRDAQPTIYLVEGQEAS